MSLWSTEDGGGELAVVWDFAEPTRTFQAFCGEEICLYSTTNPAFLFTGGKPPDGLHEIDGGTTISLELLARDAVVALQVNARTMEPGDEAFLGTVPDLHVHPSWQLVVQGEQRGDFDLSFRLKAEGSNYAASQPYELTLTNREPPPTPTPVPIACVGDCDDDGRVSVNELIQGVRMALDATGVDQCPNIDRDRDGSVSITELIEAVRAALGGCPPPLEPSLASIQVNIFTPKCAVAFCHDTTTRAGGLSLEVDDALGGLVDRPSRNTAAAEAGLLRVVPFDPDNSFLVIKVEGPATQFGNLMPLTGPPLAAEEIDAIRKWIQAGTSP